MGLELREEGAIGNLRVAHRKDFSARCFFEWTAAPVPKSFTLTEFGYVDAVRQVFAGHKTQSAFADSLRVAATGKLCVSSTTSGSATDMHS